MKNNRRYKVEDFLEAKSLLVLTLNTWIPYLYDVPVILGYPDSFQHRFRYKKQWLTESTLDTKLKGGQKGVIVLRDTLKNVNIPLRFFTLTSYNIVNDIHFMDVTLHQIIDFGNNGTLRGERFDHFNKMIVAASKKFPDIKGQKPFVYYIKEDEITTVWNKPYNLSYDDSTNWRFLNEILIEKSQFKDSNFLRIIDEKKKKPQAKASLKERFLNFRKKISEKKLDIKLNAIKAPLVTKNINSSISFKNGCYKLKSGNSYYIDLLQIIELSDIAKTDISNVLKNDWGSVSLDEKRKIANSVPYEVSITSSEDCINIAYPKRVAVGEYDRIRFRLKIGDIDKKRDCIIEVKALRDSEGIYSQPLILPALIKPRRLTKIIGAVLFLLAILCASIDDIIPFFVAKATPELIESPVVKTIQLTGIISAGILIGLLTYKVDIFKLK